MYYHIGLGEVMKVIYFFMGLVASNAVIVGQSSTAISTAKQELSTPQTARVITVNNKITKDMLGYKYIIMNYPSSFNVKVNNKTIAPGTSAQIPLKGNTLSVQYEYEFGKRRKGSKIIDFTVDPSSSETNLTFSWADDWRVKLSNGKPKKRTIIE